MIATEPNPGDDAGDRGRAQRGGGDRVDQKDDEDDPKVKVAIDASELHVVSDEEAHALFEKHLGKGDAWPCDQLMQYRTTSGWQGDWVVEVGNWLDRSRTLDFIDLLLEKLNASHQRTREGQRDIGDPVHRSITQWLCHAMAAHYFAGIGWRFHSSPRDGEVTDLRGDGTCADVDLRFHSPSDEQVVDMQVKAAGTLGLDDSEVDAHIRVGVIGALSQLPDPALGPALVVVCAQRGWWLSEYPEVLEPLIGTPVYLDGCEILHEEAYGELKAAVHVSGIVILDYRRYVGQFDYHCTVLLNPWACCPIDPTAFPYSRVLTCDEGVFAWLRGDPDDTRFPTGTRLASSLRGNVR